MGHHLAHWRHSSFAAALTRAALRFRPPAAGADLQSAPIGATPETPKSIRDPGAGTLVASELGQTTRMRGLGWNDSQAEALR
ncbi:hypothetical protein [Synechococcus sp. UW140]|uniref:hypothetical protein n=1 Tax=Synechococcus sp. UW140 TaxID=368503 RepID=UPI003137F022